MKIFTALPEYGLEAEIVAEVLEKAMPLQTSPAPESKYAQALRIE